MNCPDCNMTMLLWHDNKYHCPSCGKIIDRPEEECQIKSCYTCHWLISNWCGLHRKMVYQVKKESCGSWTEDGYEKREREIIKDRVSF